MSESKLYAGVMRLHMGWAVYSWVGEVRLKSWAFIMKVVVAMETASSPKQPDGRGSPSPEPRQQTLRQT